MAGSTGGRPGRGLLGFVPRFDEPISPEFYRFTGKIRSVTLVIMIALNFTAFLDFEALGYDGVFYARFQMVNTPVVVADLVLGLIIWRGPIGPSALHRLTMACALLECTSSLLCIWAWGSVGSHMVVYGYCLVLVYRAALGFGPGFASFLAMLIGHWIIATAEAMRWIPSQPLLMGTPSAQYESWNARFGAMLVLTVMLVLLFLVSNWMVARLRHKERTIRILRETLAVSERGRVGRHTGRTLCDTYVVGSLIGVGGMGEVYRGHHRRTKRPLALKILHPHLIDDPTLLARFRREAEVTGRLGNPHIVEIVDVDRDEDTPFMALELLEGESLGDRIARGEALPFDDIATIVEQIADGLSVAHRAGVVHRDLKPENVFLVRRERDTIAKILDFGVSKIKSNVTAITQDAALLGTPDFMAPEQAIGDHDVDARADVFALAGIAYNALTGRRPFIATSVPALLRRICDEEPPPAETLRPDLPAGVPAVLALGLAKRPAERLDVLGFAAALRAALGGAADPGLRARATAVHRGQPASRTTGDDGISATAETAPGTPAAADGG